ncbi:peptidylprolyl isomerase [Novosphingobium sp. 9U]|uniref:peptidylprolyl isomerase n=1 Tax=Novosphingobium sp. 9U TaxID=2653158 RepID=UPI0012F25B6F|nr:peptidylprolyl isomerase [Novosphingobium sp. 9U]VWX51956.1 Peptidyl-prolyl cis-trans isomerase ppiD [Novosphingobium sp. 9U]
MLHFFRTLIKSKIGAIVAIVVLGVIALSFVAGDIGGNRSLGGAGSGVIAEVGGEDITSADLNREANDALQRVRQQDANLSMAGLVARGGLQILLNDLVDLNALYAFGKDHGVIAGDRLIDSELQRAGALQPNAIPRQSVATRLVARQLLSPAEYGAVMPRELAWRYGQLLGERRIGSVAVLPALSFAPEKAPSTAQLSNYYKAHTSTFIRPERRVIRFTTFGPDVVKNVPAPTDAEIAKRYEANKALYAALERRAVTQLVVPTEAAAKAIVAEVTGGKTLEASAAQKGLAAAKVGPLSKQDFTAQSSAAVADAVFAAPKGQLVTARSPLGWYVVRVEAIDQRAGRSLEEVKGEIATALAADKRRSVISDFVAKVEEQFEGGANLPEVAKNLGLQVQTTPPLTADGAVYNQPGAAISPALKPVLKTAFTMAENEPQVAEAEPGKTFVLYDVTAVAPSAPAPFNEIVQDVKVAYALDIGAATAKAQALAIQAAVRKGEKLDAAIAKIGKKLPPIERVGMTRPELAQIQRSGRQVPPPVRLLFAMARGTVKVQEAPQKRGWFVVVLDSIEPGKIDRNDPSIANAQRELGKVAGGEYAETLRKAITKSVGVKRNEAALAALRDELSGKSAE